MCSAARMTMTTVTGLRPDWTERPDGVGDDSYLSKYGLWKLYVFHEKGSGRRLYAGITSRDYTTRWAEHAAHEDRNSLIRIVGIEVRFDVWPNT